MWLLTVTSVLTLKKNKMAGNPLTGISYKIYGTERGGSVGSGVREKMQVGRCVRMRADAGLSEWGGGRAGVWRGRTKTL